MKMKWKQKSQIKKYAKFIAWTSRARARARRRWSNVTRRGPTEKRGAKHLPTCMEVTVANDQSNNKEEGKRESVCEKYVVPHEGKQMQKICGISHLWINLHPCYLKWSTLEQRGILQLQKNLACKIYSSIFMKKYLLNLNEIFRVRFDKVTF